MTGQIYAQDGDELSEQNLNESAVTGNAEDYVVRGLGIEGNVDYTALEVSVPSGYCRILTNQQVYRVEVDAVTKTISDNSTHDVFVRIDPATDDDVSVVITQDGSTPTDTYLQIGTIDTNANDAADLNRNPTGSFESVSTERLNSRPYELLGNKTVSVPGDYATIQAACDDAPRWTETNEVYFIDIDNGTYEDFALTNVSGDGDVVLRGDTATPGNVAVKTGYVGGCSATVTVEGVTFLESGNQQRQAGEDCALVAEKNSWVRVTNSNVDTTPTRGLISYNTNVLEASDVNFEGQDQALRVKKDGFISAKFDDLTGSANVVANVISGWAVVDSSDVLAANATDLYQFESGIDDGGVIDVNKSRTITPGNVSQISAYVSADQTASSGSDNTIAFDTTTQDRNGDFDTAGSEFTAPSPGNYRIEAALAIDPDSSDQRHFIKIKNGVGDQLIVNNWYSTTAQLETAHVAETLSLDDGEQIRLTINPDSNNSTIKSGQGTTRLHINRDES
jgi:hypothetical protein